MKNLSANQITAFFKWATSPSIDTILKFQVEIRNLRLLKPSNSKYRRNWTKNKSGDRIIYSTTLIFPVMYSTVMYSTILIFPFTDLCGISYAICMPYTIRKSEKGGWHTNPSPRRNSNENPWIFSPLSIKFCSFLYLWLRCWSYWDVTWIISMLLRITEMLMRCYLINNIRLFIGTIRGYLSVTALYLVKIMISSLYGVSSEHWYHRKYVKKG